jgi:hypothetical protein
LVDERRARLGIVAEAIATLTETAEVSFVAPHEPESPLDTLSAATDLLSPWISEFFRLLNGSVETGAPFVDELRHMWITSPDCEPFSRRRIRPGRGSPCGARSCRPLTR